MVECILATDMATHSFQINSLKAKLESNDIKNGENLHKLLSDNVAKNTEVQQMILSLVVHTADLSNPAKLTPIFVKWTEVLFFEFFNQGDIEKEKGLNVSMLCDRKTTNINKSEIGFIKFVVRPQFDLVSNVIPDIQDYFNNIAKNLKYFEDQLELETQNEKNKASEK